MGRESQSKKKETKSNLGGRLRIARIENVFSGIICYKGHNQMFGFSAASAVVVGFFGHN